VRSLLEAVENHGVDARRLLADSGIPLDRSGNLPPWSAMADFERLIGVAVARTGDDAFGLHWGQSASPAAYDLVSPLAASAPTLRRAVACIIRYSPLLTDPVEITFQEPSPERARLGLRLAGDDALARRVRAEHGMVGICSTLRYFGGPAGAPKFLAFAHPRPAYAERYRAIFSRVDRFENDANVVEFDAALLDRPSPGISSTMHGAMERLAEDALQSMRASPYAERVLGHLVNTLPHRPNMAAMARLLGMSDRSLRRPLEEEGTSYPELLESALAKAAKRLIRETAMPLKAVANRLGFSGSAAFHRAFRRRTAMSPLEYRRVGGRSPT
jgi:AraC-like DNA-binding protein